MIDFTSKFAGIKERMTSGANTWGHASGNVGGSSSTSTVSDPSASSSTASFNALGSDHSSYFTGGSEVSGFSQAPIDPSAAVGKTNVSGKDKFALDVTSTASGKPGIKAENTNTIDFLTGPGGSVNFNSSSESANWL